MTTPKKPGPEPRAAQNRSAFSLSLACTSSPSAVTMSMPRMLQQAGPHRREFQPKPPCNRKPPRLTGMQWPEGKNKRSLSSARLRSAPFNPGWIVAVRVLTSTEKPFICDRSSSMPPSRRNEAAQLCPPERMPIFRPRSFASCTAATTSPLLCARTMTSGKRFGLRPFETALRRACS